MKGAGANVTLTEDMIRESYEAYRRGDVDGTIRAWHEDARIKTLANGRTYRGRDEVRRFFAEEIHESARTDFKIYTVLEQKNFALVFGRYTESEGGAPVEKGAFWIAETVDGQLFRWDGFDTVGDAFAEFKRRLSPSL